MHGEENLYTYTVAQRKTSLSIFTLTIHIYIYTPRKMYFFSVLLWLLSDILFENTNITRASVPSDHLSLRKVNAIYIYVHMEKCLRIYPYDIFYSNLYPTTLEKNNIFFSRTRIFSFSFKKKERERKTILTISPIVLTHVSLND